MRAHPLQSNVNPSAAPPLSPSLNQQSIYSNSTDSLCVCTYVWAACVYTQTIWSLMITKLSQGRRYNDLNLRKLSNEQNLLTDKTRFAVCCTDKIKNRMNLEFQHWHVEETATWANLDFSLVWNAGIRLILSNWYRQGMRRGRLPDRAMYRVWIV